MKYAMVIINIYKIKGLIFKPRVSPANRNKVYVNTQIKINMKGKYDRIGIIDQ